MEANAKAPIEDPGLYILDLLLRLIGAGLEFEQLRHNVASPVGVKEMVRYARTAGLTARCSKLAWTRLAGGPLPAIAVLRNGSFLLLGKVTGDTAIVLAPHAERPTLMTRDQFEAVWDGRLISVKKRGALASQVEQSREAAVRQLQQLWKTSLTRANDISRSLIAGGRNIIKPDAEKETPSSAAMASAGIIIFADHARKLGRAVARIRPDEERRRHDELAFLPAALEIVELRPRRLDAQQRSASLPSSLLQSPGPVWAPSTSSRLPRASLFRAAVPRRSSRSKPGSCARSGFTTDRLSKAATC